MIKIIDKLLICLGAMTVGLVLDVISLLWNMMNLFGLGTLIIATSLIIISIILYIELGKYENIFNE